MHILSHFVLAAVLSGSWATLLFPESFPLHKRSSIAPGTPLYECHANCGGAIVSAESANYCSNSTFISELEACLDCALTYDIWQYYGDDVSSAAEECGDNATPSSSSAVSTATGTAVTTSATGAASNTTLVSGTSSAAATSSGSVATSNSSSESSAGPTLGSSYGTPLGISILVSVVLGLLV